jgi:virulence-associated protein VagC
MSVYLNNRRRVSPKTRTLSGGIEFTPLYPDPVKPTEPELIEGEVREVTSVPEAQPPQAESRALVVRPITRSGRGRWKRRMISVLAGLFLAGSLGWLLWLTAVPWLFFPTATIVLQAERKPVSGSFLMASQPLAPVSSTGSTTVAATGTESQPASQARGMITFLNGGSQAVAIPQGFLLTGQDGVQVSTDHSVTVPVGDPVGQAAVGARAVNVGPQGNIAALDISGSTSIQGVLAKNYAPFTGGQDASSYQAVSSRDLQDAADGLETTLTQGLLTRSTRLVPPGKGLVTPLSCRRHITSDKPVGSAATQVRVTVEEICQGSFYDSAAAAAVARRTLVQHSYVLLSSTLKLLVSPGPRSSLVLCQVLASGMLRYQWTERQLRGLALLVTGKTEKQGRFLLMEQEHITAVFIQIQGRDTGMLPDDPHRIHLMVK